MYSRRKKTVTIDETKNEVFIIPSRYDSLYY